MDIRKVSLLADYFVLCTGSTERQLGALTAEVREQAKAAGLSLLLTEGEPRGGWVLMDYGGVVLHILSPELRAYYRLEDVWPDSIMVMRMP